VPRNAKFVEVWSDNDENKMVAGKNNDPSSAEVLTDRLSVNAGVSSKLTVSALDIRWPDFTVRIES
jgi:hypothetical protein